MPECKRSLQRFGTYCPRSSSSTGTWRYLLQAARRASLESTIPTSNTFSNIWVSRTPKSYPVPVPSVGVQPANQFISLPSNNNRSFTQWVKKSQTWSSQTVGFVSRFSNRTVVLSCVLQIDLILQFPNLFPRLRNNLPVKRVRTQTEKEASLQWSKQFKQIFEKMKKKHTEILAEIRR